MGCSSSKIDLIPARMESSDKVEINYIRSEILKRFPKDTVIFRAEPGDCCILSWRFVLKSKKMSKIYRASFQVVETDKFDSQLGTVSMTEMKLGRRNTSACVYFLASPDDTVQSRIRYGWAKKNEEI